MANVNFYAVRPESIPEFAEITQNNMVQGHSRSPIRAPYSGGSNFRQDGYISEMVQDRR